MRCCRTSSGAAGQAIGARAAATGGRAGRREVPRIGRLGGYAEEVAAALRRRRDCAARACGCASATASRGCWPRASPAASGCWCLPASWSPTREGRRSAGLSGPTACWSRPISPSALIDARARPRRRLRGALRRASARASRSSLDDRKRRARAERLRARRVDPGDRRRVDLLRSRRRAGRAGPRAPRRRRSPRAVRGKVDAAAGAARDRAAARARRSSSAPRRCRPSARPSCCANATSARAAAAPRSPRCSAGYNEDRRRVQVANSEGLLPPTTARACGSACRSSLAAATGSRPARSRSRATRASSCSTATPRAVADEAARRALTMLDARPAPAGPMTVVVGNGFGGVLFHEATGHGLESDAVQKQRLGLRRAARRAARRADRDRLRRRPHAGRVGDRRDRRRGHADPGDARDRRGRARASTSTTSPRARKDGRPSTGNGRRQSFRHLPIPRMTNTYIAPGDADPEDIIARRRSGACTRSRSRAGRSSRRPATSCSACRRAT